jgi:hypothetical protein
MRNGADILNPFPPIRAKGGKFPAAKLQRVWNICPVIQFAVNSDRRVNVIGGLHIIFLRRTNSERLPTGQLLEIYLLSWGLPS